VEISKGSLETNKNSKETYDQFFKDPHKFGGENKEDLFKRMGSFLNDLQKYKNKNILIVGHGGSFEYLKHLLLKKDPKTEEVERPYTANCEIIKFDF
jgi:broad specificity phosphatase PhoE